MSAPFKATASDLQKVAEFLITMSQISAETGVALAYPTEVSLPGHNSTISISYQLVQEDSETGEMTYAYVVEDRVGS